MLFELIFMALCISAVVQANKLKKLKRRLDSFEATFAPQNSGNVTQSSPAAPLGQEQDCVTKKGGDPQ